MDNQEQARVEEVRLSLNYILAEYRAGKEMGVEHSTSKAIDKILSLKDKDGKPMLGIISDDQNYPDKNKNHTWYKDDLGEAGKIGYDLALEDMLKDDWVKLLPTSAE